MKAYNADSLGVTGQGQTIAILIDTAPNPADVTAFWQANGIPNNPARIETVNVGGGQLPQPTGEESLDAEWSSGVAQGATIRIYASGTLEFADLDQALDRITADLTTIPSMRQLSISLGLGELYFGGPKGEVVSQNQKYLKLAAAGVNIFVSSGDAGSNPGESGHVGGGALQPEFASSDPWVIGVGGTSLVLDADGTVASETGWSDGGGGKSHYFSRPSWQKGAGMPGDDNRLVPDVSLTASPDEGALLILGGQSMQIGGTSWSAPVWAAFCALINEARAKAGKHSLSFLNPHLYPLLGTGAFRDITQGSNGAYQAGPGYDMVTGLGVPNVAELLKALG
jgi:kumamolisin